MPAGGRDPILDANSSDEELIAAELVEPASSLVVTDDVINEVYEGIRALQLEATVELAIKMGKLIVEKFYGGKLSTWRERGKKDNSFQQLAERFKKDGDLGVSAPTLYRAVGIYELDQRIGVSGRKHLTFTHLRAVLGLAEPQQRKLLETTEEKGWSSEKLEAEVSKIRKKEADGRGRPPLPAFVKTANRFRALLKDDEPFGELERLEGMKDSEVEQIMASVSEIRAKLEQLEASLAARLEQSKNTTD